MAKNRILIDAVFINNGGGKVLLLYLIDSLLKNNFVIGLIADKRLVVPDNIASKVIDISKPSLLSREKFIFKHSGDYDIILSFNNLPPLLKYSIPAFVYFHNVSYFERASNLKTYAKNFFFYLSIYCYGGIWVVQTDGVRSKFLQLARSLSKSIKIEVIPFFPQLNAYVADVNIRKFPKSNIRFVYVSDGHAYKNHDILLDAFSMLIKMGYRAELSLTVSVNYPLLINKISSFAQLGMPIKNYTFIEHSKMINFLKEHDIAIYPSSFESFGLGLIEAAQASLPIIASDESFVFDVVRPFAVFDQYSIDSILKSMIDCMSSNPAPAKLVISNDLDKFSNLLMEHSRVIAK